MRNRCETKEIDTVHVNEFSTNGCKVRLFFTLEQNTELQSLVLGNLVEVIERKKQDSTNMQTNKSHLRHAG